MRPLFTLPVPQILIDALNNIGYISYEDLFKENGEVHEPASQVLKDYLYTVEDLKSLVTVPNMMTASFKLRGEELKECIPTFCEKLDNILGGGVQLDSVLQVCGPPGSGKTLLGLQLCVAVQVPLCLGGVDGEAIFIDTEGGFSIARLKEIAVGTYNYCHKVANTHNLLDELDNFSVDTMLENIHYLPVQDHIQLMAAVQTLKQFITQHSKVKIVVIDSLTLPLLSFVNTLDRTRIIYNILHQLNEVAEAFNVAVIITNHLTTKISKQGKYLTPSLGETVSHRIAQTLLLGRINNIYSAVLIKSPYLPETVAHFNIVKDGLRDI